MKTKILTTLLLLALVGCVSQDKAKNVGVEIEKPKVTGVSVDKPTVTGATIDKPKVVVEAPKQTATTINNYGLTAGQMAMIQAISSAGWLVLVIILIWWARRKQ